MIAAFSFALPGAHNRRLFLEPLKILQFISVLVAAGILGNWYLAEYRKARTQGLPLYRAYFSLPGILIILLILFLPVIARFL